MRTLLAQDSIASEEAMSEIPIRQRFVAVGDRLVHYRTCGEGPAALLLHDSVKSSAALIPLAKQLSRNFRVFALDTPGYGNSDPLPGQPEIIDFAHALRDTLDALKLDKVFIYGRHTSSKVVLELLCHWPERFEVGVMDGLSLSDRPYDAGFVAKYLPPIEIDDRGAYLAGAWTQLADMTRWFPWFSKKGTARMAVARRDAAAGHRFALDFLMAGPNYASAYGAGLRYPGGLHRLALLAASAPAVFMAAKDDVLYSFLDQIPAGRVKESVPRTADVPERVEQIFLRHSQTAQSAPPAPEPEQRRYLDCAHGQLHVRLFGERAQSSTLFLHEVPGGAASAMPFLRALSAYGRVIAPDLPGGGDSDPLGGGDANDYARILAEMLSALGEDKVNVIAMTTATPLAVALAARYPHKVDALILDGLIGQDFDKAARFCPPIEFDHSGAYIHRVWHQLRDQRVQWPWYDGSVEAIRKVDAEMTGLSMHQQLIDVLKQLANYGEATQAAFRFDTASALAGLRCRLMVMMQPGDPAYSFGETLADTVSLRPRAVGPEALAAQAAAFFACR